MCGWPVCVPVSAVAEATVALLVMAGVGLCVGCVGAGRAQSADASPLGDAAVEPSQDGGASGLDAGPRVPDGDSSATDGDSPPPVCALPPCDEGAFGAGIPIPPIGVAPYPGATTHYVDNSRTCTDTGDPAGTAESPRCTVPTMLPAGSLVEVHGGPYSFGDTDVTWSAAGTPEAPVLLRFVDDGVGRPLLAHLDQLHLDGAHFVVDGFRCNGCRVGTESTAHHVAVRNAEIAGHPSRNGVSLGGEDIVLLGNHIHHHQGDDRHGVTVIPGARRVWILGNNIHHNGGDAVQFCHGCTEDPPRFVYIGRNELHSDRENGVDLKWAADVIVSENTLYGYREAPEGTEWCFDDGSGCGMFSSGSDGSAAVIGSDGTPERVWFINNVVRDSSRGIRNESSNEAWLVGNILYDITGGAIALEKRSSALVILGNTIVRADMGIDQFWRIDFVLDIETNMFAELGTHAVNLEAEEVAAASTLSHNLFWNGGEDVPIRWGTDATISTGAEVDSFTSGTGNLVADPAFEDASVGDFSLAVGSAAIDVAEVHPAYAVFEDTYGLSIAVDRTGSPRPSGAAWDLGALERP